MMQGVRQLRRIAGTLGLLVPSLIAVSTARPARAHVVLPRLEATRRIVIGLGGEPSLTYAISLGPKQAFLARQEADEDRNGEVDPGEAGALVERWRLRIDATVWLTIGASVESPLGRLRAIDARSSGLIGATSDPGEAKAPPLSVHWSWSLPIDDDVDRVQLRDACDLQPFEHTELEVRDSPSHRFVGIGVDEQHLSSSPHLAFVDEAARGPRVVWVLFQKAPRRFPVVAVVVGSAIAAGAVLLLVSRARARRPLPRA